MAQLLWRIEGTCETPSRTGWAEGVTLHLLFQSLTVILVRRDGRTRRYLALAGCPQCREDGCDRVCHRTLFTQLVRITLPGITLVPVTRLSPHANETRRFAIQPAHASASSPGPEFLAPWAEGRLITTWSRLRAKSSAPSPRGRGCRARLQHRCTTERGPAKTCSSGSATRSVCSKLPHPPPLSRTDMPSRAFALTERDVAILASLADVRHLTIQHLQWLHWHPRWRTHEQAARETGVVNHRPKKAYERVAALSARGLLITFTRSADRATTFYRRLPNSFSLTRAGAELLACRRGLLMEQLWYYERAAKSAATLEHSVAIGAFYAALRAELEYRGRRLSDWATDTVLSTDYDSVTLPSIIHPLPIIPDATFTLDGTRFMLEVDRGTTRIEQWRKKALAYQAYHHDPRLRERYGVSAFTILVVAPSGERLQAIAHMVASVHAGVASNYRFLAEERVHPFSIRRR